MFTVETTFFGEHGYSVAFLSVVLDGKRKIWSVVKDKNSCPFEWVSVVDYFERLRESSERSYDEHMLKEECMRRQLVGWRENDDVRHIALELTKAMARYRAELYMRLMY